MEQSANWYAKSHPRKPTRATCPWQHKFKQSPAQPAKCRALPVQARVAQGSNSAAIKRRIMSSPLSPAERAKITHTQIIRGAMMLVALLLTSLVSSKILVVIGREFHPKGEAFDQFCYGIVVTIAIGATYIFFLYLHSKIKHSP